MSDVVYHERLNGATLYFEVVGEAAAPPLFFLHGGPGYNSASFRALCGERLAGHCVVYLDQRGCGRSGPLSETDQGDETLDLDTLVADVEAVREFLAAQPSADQHPAAFDKIVPLGHGFGALIALEYARRHPQHTARVVLVNPWVHFPDLALTLLAEASAMRGVPLEDPAEEVRAKTQTGHPPIGEARVEAAFELLNARDLLNALHFQDSVSRMHLEFIDSQENLWGSGEMQEALINKGLWEFEYAPFLAQIRRPIYVIAGTFDRTSVPVQVQWTQDLGSADISMLPAGHYPWLDDEDAFIEVLEDCLRR